MAHKPNQAIKNVRGTPAAYDTTSVFEGGAYQTYVIVRCIECQEETRVHWNTGGADPAFVEKKLRGMGWHFDAYKPKNCVCPDCLTRRKRQPLPPDSGWVAAHPDSDEDDKLTREETMAKSTNSYISPPTDTAILSAATANVNADEYNRTLTTHQKAKVRAVLDIRFDDSIGRYIDNYDDKKVGEETDLPWALVAQYRELAYGPIKADPMVEAVKSEALALRDEFQIISRAAEDLRASIQRIEGRLVNVEAKARKL